MRWVLQSFILCRSDRGLGLGRFVLWLAVWLGLGSMAAASAQQPSAEVALAGSQLRFASLPEAREFMRAKDVWLESTSDFQRAATLGVTGPVALPRFSQHLADAALAWTPLQEKRWRSAIALLAPKFEALRLPLPARIFLVQTNGSDAANAPYTRANAIFLPQAMVSTAYSDAALLAHELFHVLTRHQPDLASRLYAEVGFESTAPLQWPPEWLPGRIANPDAPHSQHFMKTTIDGQSVAVMPLLVARRTMLNPGETFFHVLDVRLLAVEPGLNGQPSRPLRRPDGSLIWQMAQENTQYLARLGGNTAYIFHPEETLADNFAFLLSARPVPNPALLQRLENVLLTAAR